MSDVSGIVEDRVLEGYDDPLVFVNTFDVDLASGKRSLYKWQAKILKLLGDVKPDEQHPAKIAVRAANGSGKDIYVIAPFSLWVISTKKRAMVVITSASGVQLNTQTAKHIKNLAEKINNFTIANYGGPIFRILERKIICEISGSEIHLFATDEGSKAEGYHPSAGGILVIIVNEAKSVSKEIFDALRRCTGFSYWMNISSTGEPKGDFYNSCITWKYTFKVTYYDCPNHYAESEFEQDKVDLGEDSFLFKSKWLAEFTSIGGDTIVNADKLIWLRGLIKDNKVEHVYKSEPLCVGIDLALSSDCDETVITSVKGNKQMHLITYRNKDATILADLIDSTLRFKLELQKEHEYIFADTGGIGGPVLDILRRKGWTSIHRVMNNGRPVNSNKYRNRGAELWYKLNRFIESGAILLLDDERLYTQILSRRYIVRATGMDKLTLEPKQEMIARGNKSPDRADALVLALTKHSIGKYLDALRINKIIDSAVDAKTEEMDATVRRLTDQLNNIEKRTDRQNKKAYGSLNSILKRNNKYYGNTYTN